MNFLKKNNLVLVVGSKLKYENHEQKLNRDGRDGNLTLKMAYTLKDEMPPLITFKITLLLLLKGQHNGGDYLPSRDSTSGIFKR